jgi:O-antigen/teichoic acid export membrane protein
MTLEFIYNEPVFAMVLTLATALFCYRIPYHELGVIASGHYKQTQASYVWEVVINITISIIFVIRYGLVGVVFGTLIAVLYRIVYLVWYLSKNILNRDIRFFIKYVLVDVIICSLIIILTRNFSIGGVDIASWFILALKTLGIGILIAIIVNLLFFRVLVIEIYKSLKLRLVR